MARILVVDDSIVARNNLKTILAAAPTHEVVGEAINGEEAFEKFLNLRPDIVTMDITMPKVNGIECLKKIIEVDPEARVMMISALGQGAKILEALNSGAKHYITKPFEADKVLEALEEVMSS